MKKMSVILMILVILLVFSLKYLAKNVGKNFQEEKNKVENKLGQRLVLERDTLTIIDYSLINQNYTLSNGKQISFELVDSLKMIK